MTLKQLKHFIEQSEILIGINACMISRCIKGENIPVDDIKAVLEDNNEQLSFYLNCLKGAAKEKHILKQTFLRGLKSVKIISFTV